MSLLATIRQRRKPWAQRVLGLFVVMWLNMALQPCAMALGTAHGDDCVHCPPAITDTHAEHMSHESHQTQGEHASGGQSLPCHVATAECAGPGDYNFDGRTVKVKNNLTDLTPGLAPSTIAAPLADNAASRYRFGSAIPLPGDPPELHIVYCVYLD